MEQKGAKQFGGWRQSVRSSRRLIEFGAVLKFKQFGHSFLVFVWSARKLRAVHSNWAASRDVGEVSFGILNSASWCDCSLLVGDFGAPHWPIN